MSTLTVETMKVNSIAMSDGKSTPAFIVCDNRAIGDIVLSSGVANMSTIIYDSHTAWNVTTFKYTIPVTGLWSFSWTCLSNVSPSSSGYRAGIWKNGSLVIQNGNYGAGSPLQTLNVCTVGDLVWLGIGSSGSLSYYSAILYNQFEGILIR